MARAKLNKLYRTFVKGLITEASPLTYPEDASSGELNTILSRRGNRTRRQGIRYEEDFVMNAIPPIEENDAISEYVWNSVGEIQGKQVVVVQIGDTVHFWDMDTTPLSDNKINVTLDLKTFKAPTSNVMEIKHVAAQFSSGAGYLFIAHPMCDPVVVEYNKLSDSYIAVRVVIQIRDFEGVYDGLANDEEPFTLSKEHHYNLKNQGWVTPGEVTTPALADGEVAEGPVQSFPEGGSGGTGGGDSTYYDPYTGNTTPYNPGGTFSRDTDTVFREP